MAARRNETRLPFVLTRVFDAPREAVFRAFTRPESFCHWWGPKGCAVDHLRMDVRVGGMTHYALRFGNGEMMWGRAIYREVEPSRCLSWINSFSDAGGGLASHAGHEGWPLQILNSIVLTEESGKTRLTLTSAPIEASEEECRIFDDGHASMNMGWAGSFDQLAAFLREKSVVLTVARQFDAPPETVFDAWLDAESVAQWMFSTPGGVMERVEIVPRVGGGFEVFERRGSQLATHFGTFVEIHRPIRLAFDFATDREQGATRVTIDFEARDGGCLVTLTHELDAQWAAYGESVRAGWAGLLDGLGLTLLGETRVAREIVQMREYDAPRELVWEAWTKPEHVDHWWGPNGFETRTQSMEVRPNGLWRYTMTGPDGAVFPNHQFYMDVAAPERLIYAHGAGDEAAPPHFHVTVIFEALGARRTRVTMTSLFPSKAARDLVVEKHNAIEGGKQTLARLAVFLETVLE
ncbi:MAG: SRPBCC family protein [Terricaulis sp.]